MASRTPADSARDAGESPLRSPSEARETLDNRNHEARTKLEKPRAGVLRLSIGWRSFWILESPRRAGAALGSPKVLARSVAPFTQRPRRTAHTASLRRDWHPREPQWRGSAAQADIRPHRMPRGARLRTGSSHKAKNHTTGHVGARGLPRERQRTGTSKARGTPAFLHRGRRGRV